MFRFVCFIFLLYSFTTSAQPSWVLHKPYATQYYYIDSFITSIGGSPATEIFSKIESASKWAVDNDDELLANTLKIKAIQYANNYLTPTQQLSDSALLDMKESNKNPYLEADILQQLGTYYLDKFKKNNVAFEYYLLAYNIYKGFSSDEFPPKQRYIYELGGTYFRYGDYSVAAHYLREALAIQNPRQVRMVSTMYNTLGICYQRQKKYDSSELYLRLAYNNAIKENDSVWIGIAVGNIGMTYFLQKNYTEAIPLLQQDIELSRTHGQVKNAVFSMSMLANIYLIENHVDEAGQLLLEARAYCWNKRFWNDYVVSEKIYVSLSKMYAAKNNMQLAYLYADSAIQAKDSNAATLLAANLEKTQEKTEYIQHKLEAEQVAGERRAHSLIRNSLIMGILLLMVIGILAINRQRLIRNKLEAEKKNAEAELDAATARLISFRQSVEEKEEIIEHYEEMERLKKEEVANTDADVRSQLEQAILVTDEQWDDFRRLFEKVHKGFFSNLKQTLPDLTPAEIRFLTLTKLKLTSKEMASMLGISQNAIRMYRHRLRRKLNLDKDDMIEQLVESL